MDRSARHLSSRLYNFSAAVGSDGDGSLVLYCTTIPQYRTDVQYCTVSDVYCTVQYFVQGSLLENRYLRV